MYYQETMTSENCLELNQFNKKKTLLLLKSEK